ncbi:NLI interacting factor-like phosphatase-domain-containing protein [Globomyces pollinis-pini]|nr:NLI interacting factor-like phosphatase-domain-containing protein [Globomyces pollinis-pini]
MDPNWMKALDTLLQSLYYYYSLSLLNSIIYFSSLVFPFLPNYTTKKLHKIHSRKTLVLDLDETLVHSNLDGFGSHDFLVEVLLDKHVCLYYVYKRPYCDLFLKKVSEWFKIVIFTYLSTHLNHSASVPEYADPVIDWLDPTRTLISKRYFRDSCVPSRGSFMKNLELVEPDLSKVILLDNSDFCFTLNPDNGIPIETWTQDSSDQCLLDLLPLLDALRFTKDVRSVLSLRG